MLYHNPKIHKHKKIDVEQNPFVDAFAMGSNYKRKSLKRLFFRSIMDSDFSTARQLLEAGINVNEKSMMNSRAIIIAARQGNIKIVEFLIRWNADVNLCEKKGWNALIYACRNGSYEIAKSLIQAGAHVNAHLDDGLSPLMFACRTGNAELVQLLIEKKADINAKTKNGKDALYFAARFNHKKACELIRDAMQKNEN